MLERAGIAFDGETPMGGDRARELCLRLQEETLRRIHEDRKRASVRVAELLAMIEQRLLDPDLKVKSLRLWCGRRDNNVSTRFAEELGLGANRPGIRTRSR